MSKTLLVPERYAKAAQRSAEKEPSPDKITSKEKLPEPSGCDYVVKVGPLAYKDKEKFGDSEPWCKEGDWVIFGRYAGSRFKIEGGEVRLLNDDEILAKIKNPEDIIHT